MGGLDGAWGGPRLALSENSLFLMIMRSLSSLCLPFQYAAIYKFNLTDFGSPMLVASGA